MIKRIREEKGGFTLAELLIVVAIVLVLVAIAVPVFTGNIEQANKAVAAADIRTAKSEAAAKYMSDSKTGDVFYTVSINTSGDVGIAEGGTAVSTWDQVLGDVQGKKEVVITLKVNKDTGKIDAPLIPGESSGDGKK